ncbi:MAG: GNAT family N-acetyltransferase [Pseudomonadota bacterium]
MTDVIAQTERLHLMRPDATDWPGYQALITSPAAQYAGGQKTLSQAWHAFAGHQGHWALRGFGLMSLRTRDDTRSVGMVGAYYPEGWPEKELGWLLWPGETGQGFATEAALAARAWVYGTLGWAGAVSYIHPDNAASIAVADRLGCTRDAATRGMSPDDAAFVYRHPDAGVTP